jgi:SNF2 family DNA or RNA helicase
MLDLISIALEDSGISFCRLDGSMLRAQRDAQMRQFREDPCRTVILISLMAGGVGYVASCNHSTAPVRYALLT